MKCNKCDQDKEIKEFSKRKNTPRGYRSNCKSCENENNRKDYIKMKDILFTELGGKCCICEINDHRLLDLDHINGGGTKERYNQTNTIRYYYPRIEEARKKLQLLCVVCHRLKTYHHS